MFVFVHVLWVLLMMMKQKQILSFQREWWKKRGKKKKKQPDTKKKVFTSSPFHPHSLLIPLSNRNPSIISSTRTST